MAESNYDEIMLQLCQRLKNLTTSDTIITPETNLINQLAIDSIKLLNLIMEIEDHFDISVPLNVLADVHTVRDLADLIYKIKSTA
ncbi:acyl carrier protein [Nitrosomonas cryotolerans]|uniref:Acyl carrier protein n=1 Tax=Nitrosomonas cryotolerans ATCC 49181 TaxID=1131553 RepID=A0A1N6JDM7_9PROT|nr:acyl carrier protein [Nitrosomonas cryotolerans]SFP49684.1 acyl carrier protein [Nitrosomonas cryotolerans]SIO42458.1 acyl carrier protein [Nitrosomonas cryotolerans ATCC 49181]